MGKQKNQVYFEGIHGSQEKISRLQIFLSEVLHLEACGDL